MFALCDIPMEAVLYGMMLAAAASAVIAMGDFGGMPPVTGSFATCWIRR